ncbi:hypothetical protein GCM10023196_100040 [Actinoallomurus vinaceus]|uniref:Uncharacterized protein n=1 Tax=Actinoallomurus vinaceus TaxID=1080074 RepID=A0ABP8UTU6_9ACTN
MSFGDPKPWTLEELLEGPRSRAAWRELCPFLEGLSAEELAAVTPRLRAWPPEVRTMPDAWWASTLAGDIRPYHRLAATRRLGRLHDVECGRAPAFPEADADSYAEENDHDHLNGEASFFYSATAVAALPGLRRVVLGATAEWHHNGGDIVGWSTVDGPPLITYLDGADYHDNPFAIEVSPDGGVVATSVEGRWFAWSAATGERLWTLDSRRPWSGQIAPGSEIEEDDLDEDDADLEEDDLDEDDGEVEPDGRGSTRFSFSGDGRLLAAGRYTGGPVVVLDVPTGKVLAGGPDDAIDGRGPVALDRSGRLLAYVRDGARVVVRDATSGGAVLAEADTGLADVIDLAMAPDGGQLLAVGPDGDDLPAACRLTFDTTPAGASLEPVTVARPAQGPGGKDLAPLGESWASWRAAWTGRGPLAHLSVQRRGGVLFDGDGRVLLTEPSIRIVSFTPDGHALVGVTSLEEDNLDPIDVWFLDALE